MSEAIKLGVDVIEKAFEKLDTNIDNSDSEDEDDYRVDPIFEAKVSKFLNNIDSIFIIYHILFISLCISTGILLIMNILA